MLGSVHAGAGCPTCATVAPDADSDPSPRAQAPSEHARATARAAALSIARIADRLQVALHLFDEFAHFGKKPLFAQVTEVAQGELPPVDRLLEIAQPSLDGPPAAAELRVASDRDESGVIASVVARRRRVHAVFGQQLLGHANVSGRKTERVTASCADLDRPAQLVAGAAEQAV